jgi:hypothetical protein
VNANEIAKYTLTKIKPSDFVLQTVDSTSTFNQIIMEKGPHINVHIHPYLQQSKQIQKAEDLSLITEADDPISKNERIYDMIQRYEKQKLSDYEDSDADQDEQHGEAYKKKKKKKKGKKGKKGSKKGSKKKKKSKKKK